MGFRRGWVTLSANFTWKGISPTNVCWYQKTKVITLSHGIKMSAICSSVLSQITRVADGRIDRQMDDRITIPNTALAWLRRAIKNGQLRKPGTIIIRAPFSYVILNLSFCVALLKINSTSGLVKWKIATCMAFNSFCQLTDLFTNEVILESVQC